MEQRKKSDFYALIGLVLVNPAFREELVNNFDEILTSYTIDAEEKAGLKKLIEHQEKIKILSDSLRLILWDPLMPRGQRSGWMGSGDAGPGGLKTS